MTCYEQIYGLRMKIFLFLEGQASRDIEPCRCIASLHSVNSIILNIAAESCELHCGHGYNLWSH